MAVEATESKHARRERRGSIELEGAREECRWNEGELRSSGTRKKETVEIVTAVCLKM